MPRIKICGITNVEDAQAAVEAGADALGFVFYSRSKRYVTPGDVAKILKDIPPFITITGLFVNSSREEILTIASSCRLDVIQLHGDETPGECRRLPGRVIKAIRVAGPKDLHGLERFPVNALLLDAKVQDHYGGSGCLFDWSLLANFNPAVPLILAGGLNPDNVTMAVQQVHPYAVDVSSGVESSPGIKDHKKMVQFIRCVRQAAMER
ncbi:MAG: phosphoribosylanthranilate isomerase [Magnetococcales bacterium]|nr:phosphoribosylanthranilate isomerase [Magnetococcales bacterium]MBF0438566.1 phosphoribosylanthranilate isomerase [Magnetococcales bacterium]